MQELVCWLNENAGAVAALGSACGLSLTTMVILFARRSVKQVENHYLEANRPVMVAKLYRESNSGQLMILIKNWGNAPAYGVRLLFDWREHDKQEPKLEKIQKRLDIKYAHDIPVWGPGEEVHEHLMTLPFQFKSISGQFKSRHDALLTDDAGSPWVTIRYQGIFLQSWNTRRKERLSPRNYSHNFPLDYWALMSEIDRTEVPKPVDRRNW